MGVTGELEKAQGLLASGDISGHAVSARRRRGTAPVWVSEGGLEHESRRNLAGSSSQVVRIPPASALRIRRPRSGHRVEGPIEGDDHRGGVSPVVQGRGRDDQAHAAVRRVARLPEQR
jgi:hypothetical protein